MYNYLEKRQFNPTQKHFMFEMATGSGKTLVMAGLILECYKQGYQNFIFFVNSASILEKTKLNFTDSASSKYLFSENININDENIEIKSINNLNESHNNAINIYFSTIQGLFSLFTRAKENAITLEDLKDQKLVFLADEAHHLNTETKKKLNDSEASEKRNWESVVKLALEQNKDNLYIPSHKLSIILMLLKRTIDYSVLFVFGFYVYCVIIFNSRFIFLCWVTIIDF
ncbi:DEAD/DEAH box helicase family protein [Helicobacter pylori]